MFLLHSVEKGESARDDFYKYRLQEKSIKLFDEIPLMRKSTKNVSSPSSSTSNFDLKKENVPFMGMIDFARTRNFDIKDLLEYESSSTSFFLSKDGFLRKLQKSGVLTQIKKTYSLLKQKSNDIHWFHEFCS